MIWIALQLAGTALMLWLGVAAMRRPRKQATALVAIMLGLVLVKPVIAHIPALEPRLFPWNWYPAVEHGWFLLPAMFVFGAGLAHVWKSVWKRDLLLAVAGYLPIQCGVVAYLATIPHELTGEATPDGVCIQTSGYSCAAASSVMLLHRYGVVVTEQEMAGLCRTRAGGTSLSGTSDAGIMRGLRIKMEGRGVPEILAPDYDGIPVPSLVMTRINARVGHCIVVTEVGGERVSVLDPLYGRASLPRAQFERDWQGVAIRIRPATP
ncbi:MAG TPA: cysteine peptidase family C39 domain-containing protein [Planctomycetota bacterium]|nr:cysteine peptidase family C39 domain-containing protein [Planctomycetota bacterium]